MILTTVAETGYMSQVSCFTSVLTLNCKLLRSRMNANRIQTKYKRTH